MREIKFRAWDKRAKGFLHHITMYGLEEFFHIIFNNENNYSEIMQYTGLKDKNGKEIYEGDILNTTDYEDLEVIFQDGMFGVMLGLPVSNEDGTEYYDEFWSLDTLQDNDYWSKEKPFFGMEVIGNIYENLELLEKTNNVN